MKTQNEEKTKEYERKEVQRRSSSITKQKDADRIHISFRSKDSKRTKVLTKRQLATKTKRIQITTKRKQYKAMAFSRGKPKEAAAAARIRLRLKKKS